MEKEAYAVLIRVMPALACVVFAALFFVRAGYGMFASRAWGPSVPNKAGWAAMEAPAFLTVLWIWRGSSVRFEMPELVFFLLFELHYFQRAFVFPFLLRGRGRMPVAIAAMGALFNVANGFLLGESLFRLSPAGLYTADWLAQPAFWAGLLMFAAGMGANLHSDHVIRSLRRPGDTRHYLPRKGLYRLVTSGNYFGELLEWTGFAVLTQSEAAAVFAAWTFANLAPRAHAIRERYIKEFGKAAVGNRKRLIPYIY